MNADSAERSNRLTARRESGKLCLNNARQGYVGPRIDTLKLAGYFFGRSA